MDTPEEIAARIRALKTARRAVILAHNYQTPEVQDLADAVGDSLELAHLAAKTDAGVVVLCGVHFMAETAAALCPGKTILIPDANAGCAMANMLTVRQLANLKREHPDAVVVVYVNTSLAVKALADVCCTSSNAVAVVRSIPPDRPVIFAPDRNLGVYVQKRLGRANMTIWDGYCPVHERMSADFVRTAKVTHPGALVVAHPECRPDVLDLADHIASTAGILRFCRERPEKDFIIATEGGILHRLLRENPGKRFFPASPVHDCPDMKLATPEKILWTLEDMAPEVVVPPDVAKRARRAIGRMLEVVPDA